MLLAYIDETHAGDEDSNYYTVAVVMSPEQAKSLTEELDDLVLRTSEKFSEVPRRAELHGHELMKGSDDWAPLKRMLRARIGIYEEAMDIIGRNVEAIYIRGVNRLRLRNRYGERAYHPHVVAMKFLLEELNLHCMPHGQLVLCIADEHGERAAVRESMRDAREGFGWGYRNSELENVLDTCHFAPSCHSRPVQAADLVAYMFRRQRDHEESDERSAAAKDRMWSAVSPLVVGERVWHP